MNAGTSAVTDPSHDQPVDFRTDPQRYAHWRLEVQDRIATLVLDIDEDRGIRPGYSLKLNSYDLGVDIELHDALQRIRFEHPGVRVVVFRSAKERVFCSGANIFMLGQSSHAWKVNFCKFTNETRNGIEDASRFSGLRFIAACNGTTAGGGYELALACDEIVLVDDRASAVSLPEVPLLGVLPGTGGLTRVTDKRRVRRDHADIFCTLVEGVRGQRALDWRLVDSLAKPQQFDTHVADRAAALAADSERPTGARGVDLTPLQRRVDEQGYHYDYVDVRIDRAARTAEILVRAPDQPQACTADAIVAAGASWWPLQMARELDDAILNLRTNELEIGCWLLRTSGDPAQVLAIDECLDRQDENWFVREVVGLLRRTFARLEVSSRTLFALVDENTCFAGTLLELALAADRIYMLELPDEPEQEPRLQLSAVNFGAYPRVDQQPRLHCRFYGDSQALERVRAAVGRPIGAREAQDLGLVTAAVDDLDWRDEIRLAVEERASLSPDALTGMEANLRFGCQETLETRVFGRLSAWQNWIFIRPNAVGEHGALKVFGSGNKARFDWQRI